MAMQDRVRDRDSVELMPFGLADDESRERTCRREFIRDRSTTTPDIFRE